jgi:hypothetical protein
MVNPYKKVFGTLPEDTVDDDEVAAPKELTISDMLNKIWTYHDKLGHDASEDKIQIIRDGCLALYQEVAELIDSFPWKPWRKTEDQTFDKDNACREMVDIIFFLAKIMRAAGLTPNDFIDKFHWVLNNNLDRLENGYSLKGGDSNAQKD